MSVPRAHNATLQQRLEWRASRGPFLLLDFGFCYGFGDGFGNGNDGPALRWSYDFPSQSDRFEKLDNLVRQIELPPMVAVGGRTRLGVMVVVPAFAVADNADQPVV